MSGYGGRPKSTKRVFIYQSDKERPMLVFQFKCEEKLMGSG